VRRCQCLCDRSSRADEGTSKTGVASRLTRSGPGTRRGQPGPRSAALTTEYERVPPATGRAGARASGTLSVPTLKVFTGPRKPRLGHDGAIKKARGDGWRRPDELDEEDGKNPTTPRTPRMRTDSVTSAVSEANLAAPAPVEGNVPENPRCALRHSLGCAVSLPSTALFALDVLRPLATLGGLRQERRTAARPAVRDVVFAYPDSPHRFRPGPRRAANSSRVRKRRNGRFGYAQRPGHPWRATGPRPPLVFSGRGRGIIRPVRASLRPTRTLLWGIGGGVLTPFASGTARRGPGHPREQWATGTARSAG
jgi:hypothetical protein